MKRYLLLDLMKWKANPNRKPLILSGARQVGKTWLMKELGKTYDAFVYINFENDANAKRVFDANLSPNETIPLLEALTGKEINEKSLLILDEIQIAPKALTALKYFNEEAPNIPVIAAGSLLGLTLHHESAFPVGKVEFMNLYPMSFNEFLDALGENKLNEFIENNNWIGLEILHEKCVRLLKEYLFTGGMPEVVQNFIDYHSFLSVRNIQRNILQSYQKDFSKHITSSDIPKINLIWNSILKQLSKENKKFIYGVMKEGARAREYENALQWLIEIGLIIKVNRCNKAVHPIKFYEDQGAFKIFPLDTGLAGALGETDVEIVVNGNGVFEEFKGALTECYVCQQLVSRGITPFYWTNDAGIAELDFLYQDGQKIYALEVKAGTNLKSRSLKVIKDKYPEVHALRTSLSAFKQEEWLTNIPLYKI